MKAGRSRNDSVGWVDADLTLFDSGNPYLA
jgi:hypothetical protein